MIKYVFLILIAASHAFAAGKGTNENQLMRVASEVKEGKTYIHFETTKAVDASSVEARFLKRSLEWDLSSVGMKKDKMFIDIGSNDINNVYVSYNDEKSVRIRINLDNGKIASNYHEKISFVQEKSGLMLIMDGSMKPITNNISELNRVYEIAASSDEKIQEHMNQASVLKLGTPAPASTLAPEADALNAKNEEDETIDLNENKSEDQIPLKIKAKDAKSAAAPAMGRMLMGLLAVGLLLLSVVVIGRKINRKRLGAQFNHDSIVVVSQKYLGPKRNLTLVRVSGEYLLLGVTDNNISLIKTLAVVDDEIPALTPNDFGATVKSMSAKVDELDGLADEVDDSFSVSSLSDVKRMFNKRKYIDE